MTVTFIYLERRLARSDNTIVSATGELLYGSFTASVLSYMLYCASQYHFERKMLIIQNNNRYQKSYMQDPYSRIKERIYLPVFVSFIILFPVAWLQSSLWSFLCIAGALLSWIWLLVRVWRYRLLPDESRALARNFQMTCTVGFCILVSFGVPAVSVVFFHTISPF